MRRAIGRDDVPFELIAVKPWRRSETMAKDFRSGRVLLAGDAAHTMSPTGGFGMNTGVHRRVNLGWKLQAMLRRLGRRALLDSYDAEQRPVVQAQRRWLDAQLRRLGRRARRCAAPILDDTPRRVRARGAQVGTRLKESLREEWECLGVHARLSLRGFADLHCPTARPRRPTRCRDYVPTARPGSRAPHAWLPDGRSTLDLFGRGFVLLRFGAGRCARARPLPARRACRSPSIDIACPRDRRTL